MKRIGLPILVALLLVLAAPLFAEIELGLSVMPLMEEEAGGEDQFYQRQSDSFVENAILGFHLGYVQWRFLYGSWDALMMPPRIIEGMTTRYEEGESGEFVKKGFYLPGFLNLFDAGIRLKIGPIIGFFEAGVNYLYVYSGANQDTDFGVNARAGLGLRFGALGVTGSGTVVFNDFENMGRVFASLADPNRKDDALEMLMSNLIPSVAVVLYL
jgi:hypothetical protein